MSTAQYSDKIFKSVKKAKQRVREMNNKRRKLEFGQESESEEDGNDDETVTRSQMPQTQNIKLCVQENNSRVIRKLDV
jgi:hypothetical protein